jgi:hypothetical protein
LKTGAWEWRDPLPSGNDIGAVAYGNNMFVVIADFGVVYTSTDAMTWQRRELCTYQNFNTITFRGGQFVVTGDTGAIFTSEDARTWHARESGTTKSLYDIAYGNGVYVAVGDSGTVCVSPDAVVWKTYRRQGEMIGAITFGAGLFVIREDSCRLQTSNDGYTWAQRRIDSLKIDELQYLSTLQYTGNQFVVIARHSEGRDIPITSIDGITWEKRGFEIPSGNIMHANNLYYAYGRSNRFTVIYSSSDLSSWCKLDSTTLPIVSFMQGANIFVSAGIDNSIYTSPDAIHWTCRLARTAVYTMPGPFPTRDGIAYGGGRFVACGSRRKVTAMGWNEIIPAIYTSGDAVSWTEVPTNIKEDLVSVYFKANRFVAIGMNGGLYISSDGCSWKGGSGNGVDAFLPVMHAKGQYVAVGGNSPVFASSDGTKWVVCDSLGSLASVAYGGGVFIAVGAYGVIVSSRDGRTWKSRCSGTQEDLNSVTYGAGRFVAVGNWGQFLTSKDGITWSREFSGTSDHIHGIAYGADQFVAAGFGILASRVGPTLSIPKDSRSRDGDTIVGIMYCEYFKNFVVVSIDTSGELRESRVDWPSENDRYPDSLLDDPVGTLEEMFAENQPMSEPGYGLSGRFANFLKWNSIFPILPSEFVDSLSRKPHDDRYLAVMKKMPKLFTRVRVATLLATREFFKRQPAIFTSLRECLRSHGSLDSMNLWDVGYSDNDTDRASIASYFYWADRQDEGSAQQTERFLKEVAAINYPDIIGKYRLLSQSAVSVQPPAEPVCFTSEIINLDCLHGLIHSYLPYAVVTMNSNFDFPNDTGVMEVKDPELWRTLTSIGSKMFDARLTYFGFYRQAQSGAEWKQEELQPRLTMKCSASEMEDELTLTVRIQPKNDTKPLFYVGIPTEWVKQGRRPNGFFVSEMIRDSSVCDSPSIEDVDLEQNWLVKTMVENNIPRGIFSFSVPPGQTTIRKILREHAVRETHSGSPYDLSIVRIVVASGDTIGVETEDHKFRWNQAHYWEGGGLLNNAPLFTDLNADGLYDFVWETGGGHYFFFLQLPNQTFVVRSY